jgi:hypothetical protein
VKKQPFSSTSSGSGSAHAVGWHLVSRWNEGTHATVPIFQKIPATEISNKF